MTSIDLVNYYKDKTREIVLKNYAKGIIYTVNAIK